MTTIILGLVVLALIVFIAYRERENAKERATLADRIQAPAAASMSAYERAISWQPPEAAPDPFTDPVLPERHHDLVIEALLEDQ